MEEKKLKDTLDQFLEPKIVKNVSPDQTEYEECDIQTGECFVIKTKDGIVERINKTFVTEDGRQLLHD